MLVIAVPIASNASRKMESTAALTISWTHPKEALKLLKVQKRNVSGPSYLEGQNLSLRPWVTSTRITFQGRPSITRVG